ncbi:MAG TPA: SpoIIE family protein phosphatase [Gemmata sp.]|nr:SpoIIE family protein phosphatase [Gemmata sp.]
MPTLILLKAPEGVRANMQIPLTGDIQIIGRDTEKCQIVIPHHAVSREHAKISVLNGEYFIEDGDGRGNRSRNHTFVNSRPIDALTPLRPDDRIKICDFLFQFRDERVVRPKKLPPELQKELPEAEEPGGMTTIEATQSKGNAHEFLQIAPADRLRALLDISTGLSRTLELDPLLNQIADTLLGVFKQADRCFVLLLDEAGRPIPKVTRNRRVGSDDVRFSRTIVRKAVESGQSFLSEDASSDAALGPAASIAEFRIRSVMCVPMATPEGRPMGAILLDTQVRDKKFGSDDLSLLSIVANLASVALEKARMHEDALAREKVQKEIELARQVQLDFLPQTLPLVDGYEFYAHYSPAQTVGGDYYDFVPLPGGRLAVVLGDVAGKGVPAALLVAKLSSEVKFCLATEPDPARAVTRLNDQMMRGGLRDRFVTLAVLVLDPVAHAVTVVNAGHMNPKLYRAEVAELSDSVTSDQSGLPLGVVPAYEYGSVTIPLAPGDTLAVYTDGVTDAMNPAGEMFGYDRVDRNLSPEEVALEDGARAKRMGERLVADVRRHANGRAQNDDIAVVCFGRLEAAHGPNTGLSRGGTAPIKVST